jgi:4-aminobutyrate aminotransferase/(S)-3-amino-2-methylpropionate transaminase
MTATRRQATRRPDVRRGHEGDLLVGGKRYGLVLDIGGYHKNVITLAPNLLITREEIDLALNLLDQLFVRAAKR